MLAVRKYLKELYANEAGIAYVEFALSISLLLVLFLGTVEVTRCVLIVQKLEKTVTTVTDVVTQADSNTAPLTTTEMAQLMSAITNMMNPYSTGVNDPNIKIIVTDVMKTGTNNPVVNWQYCGGGTLAVNSSIGTTIGGTATLPNNFVMTAGEEVVVGEVFYNFSPLIASNKLVGSFRMYRTAIYAPRLGALTAFSSHC